MTKRTTHPMLLGARVAALSGTYSETCFWYRPEDGRPSCAADGPSDGVVIAAGEYPKGGTWVTVRHESGALLYCNKANPDTQIPLSLFKVVQLANDRDRAREEMFIAAAFAGYLAGLKKGEALPEQLIVQFGLRMARFVSDALKEGG